MSKTKTKKAPSQSKPTKAAKKPAAKAKKTAQAPAEVAVQAGVCPKGGDHEWKTEDGKRFCEKCFEPGDDAAPVAEASAEVAIATVDQPTADQPTAEQPTGEQLPADQPAAETTGKKRKAKAPSEPRTDAKLSAIDAAAKVLTEAGQPMNTKEMITTMAEKGYWTSPGGKTPAATLYSAILREITTKAGDARFQKTERGKFAVRGA
jgi:hypothetical protein